MSDEVNSVENEESQGVTEEQKETATAIANQVAEKESNAVLAQDLSMSQVVEDVIHRSNQDGESSVAEMTAIAIDEVEGELDEESSKKSDIPQYHDDGQAHLAEDALDIITANGDFFFQTSPDGARRMEYWREENAALQLDYAVQVDAYEIDYDVDGDGQLDRMSLMDAVAASNDSILDLYINEQFEKVLADLKINKWTDITGPAGVRALALKGIRVEAVQGLDTGTRAYALSLIDVPDDIRALMNKPESELTDEEIQRIVDAVNDPNAKVLKDADGKLGSCLKTDNTTADGYVQPTELNLQSELDLMGYDCLSKADFIGHEDEYYAIMAEIESGLRNGAYEGASTTNEIYGCTYKNGDSRTYDGRLVGFNYGSGEFGNNWFNEFMNKFGKENIEQNTQYQAYVQQLIDEQIAEYRSQYGTEPNAAQIAQFTSSAEQQAAIMYSEN